MPREYEPWVLDTHIWIWQLNGDPALGIPEFQAGIRERSESNRLRIASITLWETAMLSAKGRLKLNMPVLEWLDAALRAPGLSVEPIGANIAADSALLPGSFHGDPADRLIIATARHIGATLITFDQAILEYGKEGWVHVLNPFDMKG